MRLWITMELGIWSGHFRYESEGFFKPFQKSHYMGRTFESNALIISKVALLSSFNSCISMGFFFLFSMALCVFVEGALCASVEQVRNMGNVGFSGKHCCSFDICNGGLNCELRFSHNSQKAWIKMKTWRMVLHKKLFKRATLTIS